jgi:hypothetical protein
MRCGRPSRTTAQKAPRSFQSSDPKIFEKKNLERISRKEEKEESPPPQFLFHVFPVILEVPHAILSAANAREDASTISRKLPVPCTTN